nr:hypothetical protein [Tanacetum cinerariifolium]
MSDTRVSFGYGCCNILLKGKVVKVSFYGINVNRDVGCHVCVGRGEIMKAWTTWRLNMRTEHGVPLYMKSLLAYLNVVFLFKFNEINSDSDTIWLKVFTLEDDGKMHQSKNHLPLEL